MTGQDTYELYKDIIAGRPSAPVASWNDLSWAERDDWEALADQANSKQAQDNQEVIPYA